MPLKSILFSLFLLTSCSTPMLDRFQRIEVGMDKSEVLDEMGSPTRSQHVDQEDIWHYNFQSEDTVEYKQVVFKNGFVTYAGEPRKKSPPTLKTEQEASDTLEKALKVKKKSPAQDFIEVKEDGTF